MKVGGEGDGVCTTFPCKQTSKCYLFHEVITVFSFYFGLIFYQICFGNANVSALGMLNSSWMFVAVVTRQRKG